MLDAEIISSKDCGLMLTAVQCRMYGSIHPELGGTKFIGLNVFNM